jgi:hypothetical protein
LEELVEYCESVEKKKVAHNKIIENQKLVENNYSIMQLYNPSISVLNRKKIDYTIASFEAESNKMNFTKMLFEDGQGSLNFTDLWNLIKKLER